MLWNPSLEAWLASLVIPRSLTEPLPCVRKPPPHLRPPHTVFNTPGNPRPRSPFGLQSANPGEPLAYFCIPAPPQNFSQEGERKLKLNCLKLSFAKGSSSVGLLLLNHQSQPLQVLNHYSSRHHASQEHLDFTHCLF